MKTLIELARAITALFVDDELLAIGIIAVVSLAAMAAATVATPLAAGSILIIGSILVLVACTVRTTYRK